MKIDKGLLNPPKEYSVLPFWFWNDRLDTQELIRQIDDFEQHGVHGFVIHPRVGLPRELTWMSERLLFFYEIAIKEAHRRGMKVLLYDEGMYPSGSSCGQVVQANSDFQCRGLAKIEHVGGKAYKLKNDENLIALAIDSNGVEVSIIDRKIDSRIRGLHYIGDGPNEDAPLAADILNPKAVDCFIDLVYRKFTEHFADYLGKTIIGIFTDEPNVLGKCRETDVFPSTKNLIPQINDILGYDFAPHIAKLWSSDKKEAGKYYEIYHAACNRLLQKNYYSRLSRFCQQSGIALTGHPEAPDDIGGLRLFDIPGQDLVWRWVLPDTPSALEGPQSTQAKCSSSSMIHTGKRRNLNECCGAYGHEMTWEEMLWLSNWCMVRGVNMLVPHAFYYSTRDCRKDERPPALGPNSPWWDKYKSYANTFARLSWLNTGCKHICHVGILGKADKLPWHAARICFENQIDFNYIEERHLWENAEIADDGVKLAGMHYKFLIVEIEEDTRATDAVNKLQAAGCAIRFNKSSDSQQLIESIKKKIQPNVSLVPHQPGLRIRHITKNNTDYYILFNETKAEFKISIGFPSKEETYQIDLVQGIAQKVDLKQKIHFAPHEIKIFGR